MPSTERSTHWFIRITAPWDFIKIRVEDIKNQIDYDGMVVGYHIGKKNKTPHAHICLKLKSSLQKQSIDTRYKKLFNVKGKLYSAKVWDTNIKCMSYLFHDEHAVVDNFMGLTDAQINELKAINDEIQKVVKHNKGKASHKVIDYAMSQIEPDLSDGVNKYWTRAKIAKLILTAVAHGEFYDPGDFQLERYLNEIELKIGLKAGNLDDVIEERIARLPSFRR